MSRIALPTTIALFLSLVLSSLLHANDEPLPGARELSRQGPHEIRAYTTAPIPDTYRQATIYYPLAMEAALGGVVISPGFTQGQRNINWWGSRLASHGYAVLVLDTLDPQDRPDVRSQALLAGIGILREEHGREGSPLHGRIDRDRMAVMGHSMGGGGALIAANAHGEEIAASIPFTPWQPAAELGNTRVPTLIIAGEADRIAPVADHARPHFSALPEDIPRAYLEIAGGDHFIGNNRALEWHGLLGRYAIAWLRWHMDGDERYSEFFTGEQARDDEQHFFSRYQLLTP